MYANLGWFVRKQLIKAIVFFNFFKTPVVAFLLKIYPEKSAPAAGFSASANVNSVAG